MFCHFNEYELGIMEMKKGDIVEIDGIDELIKIDKSYENIVNGGQKDE